MKAEDVKTYDDLKLIIDHYEAAYRNLDKEGMKNAVKEFSLGITTLSIHREDWPEWAIKFGKETIHLALEIEEELKKEHDDAPLPDSNTARLLKTIDSPKQRALLNKYGFEFHEENEKELVFKRK